MCNIREPWLRSAFIAFGVVGAVGSAVAATHPNDSQRQSISDVPFTGPLAAPNPTALPIGHWIIEPYLIDSIVYGSYDDDGNESSNPNTNQAFRSVTLIEYGVTKKFTAALLPIFGYNHIQGGASSDGVRLGDLTLRAHYTFHTFHEGSSVPTMAFALSENLPTGSYDGLSKTANGLGSGVWSTKIGFWTQDYFWMPNGHILRTRFSVSYAFPDDNSVAVNGRSVYGTGPGFAGEYNPGNTVSIDVAAEYALTNHWAPAVDIVYSHTGNGTTIGTQPTFAQNGLNNTSSVLGTNTVNRGTGSSESLEIDPAIEYLFNGRYGLIVGAAVTVFGRNSGASVTPQAALDIFY